MWKRINILVLLLTLTTKLLLGQGGMDIDRIVGKVDNLIILRSEVERNYLQALQSGEKESAELKCRVFQDLIIQRIMVAKAEIDSITVDQSQVQSELDRRMDYMIASLGGDVARIEKQYGKSVAQLKEELRPQVKEQLIVQEVQRKITGKVKVTPSQVKKFYKEIPADSLPFFSTEVEVAQIVVYPKPSDKQKEATRRQTEELRNRVLAGESFEKLAVAYSEDPGSAARGGELGFWGRGEMVPEFEAAALRLKPGEMSGVIESQYGFHIIQLIEVKDDRYNARHILRKIPPAEADETAAINLLDSLRTRILADSLSFAKAALKYSEDDLTKTNGGFFFDPQTRSQRVPLDQLTPDVFFTIDSLKVGQICHPVKFTDQAGKPAFRIVYYKLKVSPHRANLDDDYQRIQKACLDAKKNQMIMDWFRKEKNGLFIDTDPEYKHCANLDDIL